MRWVIDPHGFPNQMPGSHLASSPHQVTLPFPVANKLLSHLAQMPLEWGLPIVAHHVFADTLAGMLDEPRHQGVVGWNETPNLRLQRDGDAPLACP